LNEQVRPRATTLPEAVPRFWTAHQKDSTKINFAKENLRVNRDPISPDTASLTPFPRSTTLTTRAIMFRPIAILRPHLKVFVTRTPASFCTSTRLLASKPKTGPDSGENGGRDDDELDAARRWLANFDAETIPRSICDVSFSRSSGPGGQNVNKYIHIPSATNTRGWNFDR
jgi:hypothetical protein